MYQAKWDKTSRRLGRKTSAPSSRVFGSQGKYQGSKSWIRLSAPVWKIRPPILDTFKRCWTSWKLPASCETDLRTGPSSSRRVSNGKDQGVCQGARIGEVFQLATFLTFFFTILSLFVTDVSVRRNEGSKNRPLCQGHSKSLSKAFQSSEIPPSKRTGSRYYLSIQRSPIIRNAI